MTNNTVIRLITFTVIFFCFITMFLTATLSVPADFSPSASAPGPVAISGSAADSAMHVTALSFTEETADTPSM